MRDGFVARDAQSKQFSLGPELMVLGAAALRRFDPRPLARPSLLRLVGQFEDSVVLSIPSGVESLCIDVEVGGQLQGPGADGQPQMFHVVKIKGPVVHLDGNHPLAGKALRFACKVTEVRAATAEEIAHRHVHGGHGHHH